MALSSFKSRDNQFVRLDVPAGISLFERQATEFLNQIASNLRHYISTSQRDLPPAVLLIQNDKATDFSRDWLQELRHQILAGQLAGRLLQLRVIFELLRNSPVHWCWVGGGSCLGSWFWLASACHSRLWLNTGAKVGCPEMEAGLFAWGAAPNSPMNQRDAWTGHREVSILKSVQLKMVTAAANVSNSSTRETIAAQWLSGFLQSANQGNSSKNKDAFTPQDRERILDGSVGFSESDDLGSVADPWSLLLDRSKNESKIERELAIAQCGARALLSRQHIAWMSGRVGRAEMRRDSRPPRAEITQTTKRMLIDLNQAAPPASCIYGLLEKQMPVTFFAASARHMTESLGILFGRLEKLAGGARASVLWDRRVSWFVGPVRPQDQLLAFGRDESILVRLGGKQFRYYRLEGNHPGAPAGWVEAVASIEEQAYPEFTLATSVVEQFSDGVLTCPQIEGYEGPMFAIVRLIILEELVRASRKFGAEFDHTLDALKKEGWGGIAFPAVWERFLAQKFVRTALRSTLLANLVSAIYGPRYQLEVAQVSASRQARDLAKANNSGHEHQLTTLRLSQHFLYFIGMLNAHLCTHFPAEMASVIMTLTREAAGMPKQAGLPDAFIASRGRARTLYYVKQNWADLTSLPGI